MFLLLAFGCDIIRTKGIAIKAGAAADIKISQISASPCQIKLDLSSPQDGTIVVQRWGNDGIAETVGQLTPQKPSLVDTCITDRLSHYLIEGKTANGLSLKKEEIVFRALPDCALDDTSQIKGSYLACHHLIIRGDISTYRQTLTLYAHELTLEGTRKIVLGKKESAEVESSPYLKADADLLKTKLFVFAQKAVGDLELELFDVKTKSVQPADVFVANADEFRLKVSLPPKDLWTTYHHGEIWFSYSSINDASVTAELNGRRYFYDSEGPVELRPHPLFLKANVADAPQEAKSISIFLTVSPIDGSLYGISQKDGLTLIVPLMGESYFYEFPFFTYRLTESSPHTWSADVAADNSQKNTLLAAEEISVESVPKELTNDAKTLQKIASLRSKLADFGIAITFTSNEAKTWGLPVRRMAPVNFGLFDALIQNPEPLVKFMELNHLHRLRVDVGSTESIDKKGEVFNLPLTWKAAPEDFLKRLESNSISLE